MPKKSISLLLQTSTKFRKALRQEVRNDPYENQAFVHRFGYSRRRRLPLHQ
jgi:hypothetical protein